MFKRLNLLIYKYNVFFIKCNRFCKKNVKKFNYLNLLTFYEFKLYYLIILEKMRGSADGNKQVRIKKNT